MGYWGSVGYTGSKGYDGSHGYTGSQGYWGSVGYTGSQGYWGSVGYTGSAGYNGSMGYWGSVGYTGSQGYWGSVGYSGSQGYWGSVGYTGSKGIDGYSGSVGYTGSKGVDGYSGSVGYAGSVGFTGSLGYAGSAGPSNVINATNDTSTTPLYPVMVAAAGSDQTPKVTTGTFFWNASTGQLNVNGAGIAVNATTATDTDSYGGKIVDIKGPLYVRQSNSSVTYLGIGAYLGTTYIKANGANNQLAISTAGSESMRITANGNVGVGTTAPSTVHNVGAPHLVVKGMGDLIIAQATTVTNGEVVLGPDYIYQNKGQSLRIGTNNTQVAVFDSTGKFGINQTSPSVLLHVTGSGELARFESAAGAGRYIRFNDSGGTKYNFFVGAQQTLDNGFEITPSTAAGGSTFATPAISVMYDGKVGINDTAPGEKLEVGGNINIFGSAGAVGSGLAYYLGPSNNSRDLSITRVAAATMAFGRYTSAWGETMRIGSDSSLGLGTGGGPGSGAQIDFAKNTIYFGPNSGPGVLSVYEAESMNRTGGSINTDATASGGQNWGTNQNYQIYGPYTNLPRGNYRLVARVKVGDVTYTGNAVRITMIGASSVSADRYLKGTDFKTNNVWEMVSIPFNVSTVTSANIEYYVFGLNSQQIYVDYIMVVPDTDSYSQQVWGNLGIGTNPSYKFHLSNSGNTTQAFYVDVGNYSDTQTLFEHTGASTPVPFRISKSGFSGASADFGILHLDMAHNVAGGGANLHFTLRDSASNVQEYGGIGSYIVTNTNGAENGNVVIYTTQSGTARLQRVTVRYDGNVGVGTTNPTYKLEVNGSFAATTKSFVIDHPTKPGMKLRYGSLEGPENGVYVRGRLNGTNVIELPEYWTKLVDADSITVNITSVGKHQKLFVKEIANNKIFIGNDALFSNQVDCFYVVYGERKDVEKLQVEIY